MAESEGQNYYQNQNQFQPGYVINGDASSGRFGGSGTSESPRPEDSSSFRINFPNPLTTSGGPENNNKSFLDKFRSTSNNSSNTNPFRRSSRSVISTPTSTSPSQSIYGLPNSGSHPEESSPRGSKPRKWFSFSSLNSRLNLSNLLNLPKSRLSVSSTLSSVFNGGNISTTPSPTYEDREFGPKIYNSYKRPELGSPTPSCATVSGEYPSRFSNYLSFTSSGIGGGGGGVHSNQTPNQYNNPVILRRRRSSGRCVSGSSYSFRGSSYSSTSGATRLSCGEFYPGSMPNHPNEFQHGTNVPGYRNSLHFDPLNNKRSIGKSLPTLIETMEAAGTNNSLNLRVPVESVIDLLYQEFAILTGAKSLDDHYIILFPDRGNFQYLAEEDYRRLMIYLTSVPPLQDAESGFVIIIDRRNDKWNSVKNSLQRISNFFPGLIHRVFVLRPNGFLSKALSEVSTKLFRDNLRFRLTVCNHVADLVHYVGNSGLTSDLGGTLIFNKVSWVQQRIEVEGFAHALQLLSKELRTFTESFSDLDLPNDVGSTEAMIIGKSEDYQRLTDDLGQASGHGLTLVGKIKEQGQVEKSSIALINIISVERLVTQIEETNRLFQEFWCKELAKLEACLKLRRFEQEFRELQASFDLNIKTLASLGERGENSAETDALIAETQNFQQGALEDVKKAIDLEATGREISVSNPSSIDSVEPKCVECSRMASQFRFALEERISKQYSWRRVQITVEKANKTCFEGVDMIAAQKELEGGEEESFNSLERTDEYLERLAIVINELVTLKNSLNNNSLGPQRALVKQILKRAQDVQDIVVKRRSLYALQSSKIRSKLSPSSIILNFGSTPSISDFKLGKSLVDGRGKENDIMRAGSDGNKFMEPVETAECRRIKRGHVLNELLSTEKTYVEEMGEILTGYRDQIANSDLKLIQPPQLTLKSHPKEKAPIIFCNLEEIYSFHSKIFSPDLSNCIQQLDLVGLCFIQRNEEFLSLYSKYCQLLPASESLRKEIGENHPWFVSCRNNIGHKLPLGAYLLKPVQRITKYQLLLKDLVKYSEGCEGRLELIEALDCMLIVLRTVNDGMHQLSIAGFPTPLHEEGLLLLQGPFTLWTETAKDKLRISGHQRHVFLYQKSLLICKKGAKSSVYEFRTKVNLSEVGLTESLKGSGAAKKFEIWVQGRQKVFLLQAETQEIKELWVRELKRLLMEQLESLRSNTKSAEPNGGGRARTKLIGRDKGASNGWRSQSQRPLRQTTSWDIPDSTRETSSLRSTKSSRGSSIRTSSEIEEEQWSSDITNSDDEESTIPTSNEPRINPESIYGAGEVIEAGGPTKFVALTDYNAAGDAEINLKEGDIVTLLKVGCAGWWFVSINGREGWTPMSYLEQFGNKHSSTVSSLCSSSSGGGLGSDQSEQMPQF